MELSIGTRSTIARFGFESILIVISILVALGIDSWWDDRQEARQRAQLVQSLIQDFEATKSRLEASISEANGLIERSRAFLDGLADGERQSLETMRHNIGGAFSRIDFEPALSAYEAAVATGQIGLLDSPDLMESITGFNQARHYYEMHDRIGAEIFYLGPIWELRREIGSLRILFRDPATYPVHLSRSDEQYRAIYASPLTYAAIEAMSTAHRNTSNSLTSMLNEVDKALIELEQLQ